jgi:nucleoside 2-deoxyribosyltransferase
MDIYVAGKTDDWERVRRVQESLVEVGHMITYDWTVNVEDDVDMGLEADERTRREWADDDQLGVKRADTVIFMVESEGLSGTLIELGMALAYEKNVIVVGIPERNSVFFSHALITEVPHEDDILSVLPE